MTETFTERAIKTDIQFLSGKKTFTHGAGGFPIMPNDIFEQLLKEFNDKQTSSLHEGYSFTVEQSYTLLNASNITAGIFFQYDKNGKSFSSKVFHRADK